MSLKLEHIYSQKSSLVNLTKSIDQVEAIFINAIDNQIREGRVEGLDLRLEQLKSGGIFSKKIKTLHITAKKSSLKHHEAYYFVSNNGNFFECTLYCCINKRYIEPYKEKPENQRIEFVQNSFSSFQERNDFQLFHSLTRYFFDEALNKLKNL